MNIKFAMTLLLGSVLMFASPVRATRTESGYGVVSSSQPITGIGEQWLVPLSFTGGVDGDVLLQITSDLNTPIQVTLDLSTSFNPNNDLTPDSPFGLMNCSTAVGNLTASGAPCFNSVSNPTGSESNGNIPGCVLPTQLGGVGVVTITLPTSCLVAGATLYFDETDQTSPTTGLFSVAPADVSFVNASVPEPKSLALLGIAWIPLAFLSRRRATGLRTPCVGACESATHGSLD